jgi:uncharacterized protein YbaR (Trm112 family)
MDTRLMELLVCPLCKGPLRLLPATDQTERRLACRPDRLAFPIRDGLPILLEDEAQAWDPDAPPPLPDLAGHAAP